MMPTSAPPVIAPARAQGNQQGNRPVNGHAQIHPVAAAMSTSRLEARPLLFESYKPIPGTFDEMVDAEAQPRPDARGAVRPLDALSREQFSQYQSLAELSLYSQGVTFSV